MFTSEFLTGFRLVHRARLTHFLAVILVISIIAALLAAQFSGRQPASVALDVGISVIRLLLPVLAVLVLQELFYREFDRRYYFISLTYPRSRWQFLAARSLAALGYAIGALIVLAAFLWIEVTLIGKGYAQATPPDLGLAYIVTIAFLAMDIVVTAAVGTLISISATSASFVLVGTLGFVLCARSFSPIIDLLTRDSSLVMHAESYQSSLHYLGYIMPDLARLDVRMITLYGKIEMLPADWPINLLTSAVYSIAMFCVAAWALNRRSFS